MSCQVYSRVLARIRSCRVVIERVFAYHGFDMAVTVLSGFQKLKQNLGITGLQKSTVSTRQQNVRKVIEGDLQVRDSFLTGSYSRSTMIAPLTEADIDIFVVLSAEYYESDGQAKLLDSVRRVLLKTYTKTPKISRNGQAVTITFSDFVVDVVPAFHRNGGGYLIPDTRRKSWISTDPKTHVKVMSDSNAAHNGELVPVVKMLKGWNREISRAFESFYLELFAREILTGIRISNYPSAMRYLFDKGRDRIKRTVNDPVSYGEQVHGLAGVSTVDDAVSRFSTAYSRARKAEEYAAANNHADAIAEWRKIFGDYFPSYG